MANEWDGIDEIVAIADAGSFVGAALKLGVSPSHVSRVVARIETRVGARLFERTTRSVRMTDAGRSIVDRCRRLIEDRDETLQSILIQDEMEGQLRVTCSVALGEQFLEPLLRAFQQQHPKVAVWLELTNRVVDVIGEAFDVAIRTGHPSDDRLAARQIASRSATVAASPSFLERHGMPQHPNDLARYACLIGTSPTWHFLDRGRRMTFVPTGSWRCNHGNSVVQAAIAGRGFCQLPDYYVRKHITAGDLQSVLDDFRDEPEPIWAVVPNSRARVPRVQRLAEFLAAEFFGAVAEW